jgi:ABC-type uncharacterized transport system ATPase subunit
MCANGRVSVDGGGNGTNVFNVFFVFCANLTRQLLTVCGSSFLDFFQLKDASFAWGEESEPTLKNLSVVIPRGSLVAIVGRVGAGKSTFLSALLGDADKVGTGLIKGHMQQHRQSKHTSRCPYCAFIRHLSVCFVVCHVIHYAPYSNYPFIS